jgi:hypothetical protein
LKPGLKASMRGALGDADVLVLKQIDRGESRFLPLTP